MIGIVLAQYNSAVQKWLMRRTPLQRAAAAIAALSTAYIPAEVYNHHNASTLFSLLSSDNVDIFMKIFVDLLLGIACGYIVVLARCFGEKNWLLNSLAMKWLGKMSYSLYLVHLPLVFFIFRGLLGKMQFWGICLVAIGASLAAASLFHIVVEQPSIHLGKYLSKKIREKNPHDITCQEKRAPFTSGIHLARAAGAAVLRRL
jgi:peptidoglycan/LPS O-acetylase OafA/YrhL